MKKIIVLTIIAFVNSCIGLKVTDIQKGRGLDKAKETNVYDFFNRRMENSIKKITGHNWEILYETDSFVFFGYPYVGNGYQYVDELYKVKRKLLESQLPEYEKLVGYLVKKKAYEYSVKPLKQTCGVLEQNIDYDISLQDTCISVYIRWERICDANPKVISFFELLLDKNNLNLIKKTLR